ncbi:LIC_13387 family protein [Actinoplanes sp. NPDC049118]|uniref:LIC_13387 family protein n=1 Tax=Actinoplanes sp. NPDC049118 TaxID=3155769 RepID=UPI0034036F36
MIPASPSARGRSCAIGAWSLLIAGVTHGVAVAVGAATATPAAERATREAMAATHVDIGGLDRTLWQLFMGFSLSMALFIAGLGALNLLALRRAPHLFDTRAALWLNLAVVLPAFVLATLLFPPPPIALLGVACAGFGFALTRPGPATVPTVPPA